MITRRPNETFLALSIVIAASACGGASASAPGARGADPAAASLAAESSAAKSDGTQQAADEKPVPSTAWTVSDVAIVPAKASDMPKSMPKPWIETPGFEQALGKDWIPGYKVLLKITGQAPAGSFVQYVLDGVPAQPVSASHPSVKLTDLAGPEGIAEGEHILAAYLTLPNRQAIKGPNGISVHRFWVGKKSAGAYESSAPMLVLGPPFGKYSGTEADEILVDWYVLNAALGDNAYSVRMTLNGPGLPEEGSERVTREWRPWNLVSPHNGEYTLKVELFGPDGSSPRGGTIVRKFTVDGRSD